MKISLPVLLTGVFLLGLQGSQLQGQPYGLTNRVANTTLRMPPAPPVYGYVFSNAFGPLNFPVAVGIASPPGETNRIFVIEQQGRIAVVTNLASPNRTVFMDITSRVRFGGEQGLL